MTQLYDQLREEIAEEFDRVAADRGHKPGHRWPWTVDKLLGDVGAIASVDASVDGKGYKGEWPVPIRRMVTILRDERNSLRRAKEAEIKRELQSRAR